MTAAVACLAATRRPRAPRRSRSRSTRRSGQGTDHFDLAQFGADFAYTFDGSGLGEIEIETFSAFQVTCSRSRASACIPGSAKGRLVNALKLAARSGRGAAATTTLSPETTEEREGFVHPDGITRHHEALRHGLDLARDHDDAKLDKHVALVRALADEVAGREPRARSTLEVEEQYRNMRPVPRPPPRDRRRRRGGDPAGRRRAGAHHHPGRHRRRAAHRARAADAEHLHRRSGVPLAEGVGERAGHGRGGRDGRRVRPPSGRAVSLGRRASGQSGRVQPQPSHS